MTIEVVSTSNDEIRNQTIHPLVASNIEMHGPANKSAFSVLAKDGDKVIGGANGYTHWNYCFIEHLWVDAAHRKAGLGAQLVQKVESEASTRGARYCWVDTFVPNRRFYENLGYELFGELQDYTPKGSRFFFTKKL